MRNKVVSIRRRAVQEDFTKLCKEKFTDQRKFWSTIRPFIYTCKQKNNNHIILKDNYKIIRDQREVEETLNDFFSNITSTEQTNVIKKTGLMIDFMRIPSDTRSGCTSLSYTKTTEVIEVIGKMKINKAVGHDLMPAGALKSQLKSYAVFFAQDLISSSTQAKFLKRGKKVK